MKITHTNRNIIDKILNSVEENEEGNYKPIGRFWFKNEQNGYTAIDNSSGCAWFEDFDTLKECVDYLNGKTIERR